MPENESNGTNGKAKELISIAVVPFPEWDGPTVTSDKRIKGTDHKLSIVLPVPESDEDMAEFYPNIGHSRSNSTGIQAAKEMGIVQWMYGETSLTNLVHEQVKEGVEPDELDTDELAAWAKEACQREVGRKPGKTAEVKRDAARAKTYDEQAKAAGFESVEQMIAEMKRLKGE